MADVEPYVDMPYSELANLKKQIKNLQGKPNVDSEQLIKSMTNLTKNMDSMLQLFKTAADEMKLEEQEEKELSRQIQPLMDKLDEIIEQNKIIAEGMVAVSDLVRERLEEPEHVEQEQPKFPRMPPRQPVPPVSQPQNIFDEQFMPPPRPIAPPSMQPPPMGGPLNTNLPPSPMGGPPPMDLPPPPGGKKPRFFGNR